MEPHLQILHTVAETVNRSLDVDEVVLTALDALTKVTGHEIASLHLLSGDGRTLELRGDRGLSPELREVNRVLPVGEGVIGEVAASGEPARFSNMAASATLFPPARAAVQRAGIRGFVCVPIRSRGRILGTLSLGRQTPDRFKDRELALLEATADQIGLALDNARLYSETVQQLEELRRTQAQLVHAEKLSAVGQLASGVAHEINNPLTTILGQAQLMLQRPGLPAALRDRIAVVAEEAARAAGIVQNLLLFARSHPPERRPCSLPEQARRVLDLAGYVLKQHGVRAVLDLDEETPSVWADGNQLQQVLLNLVQNAAQAMTATDGPRVLTVRARPDGPRAIVEVLDTGPGIPPDALARVFDPFFTTKPPGEGSGLGLSVSYGIVTEHGGTLRAGNRPEGGACFVVALPRADEAR